MAQTYTYRENLFSSLLFFCRLCFSANPLEKISFFSYIGDFFLFLFFFFFSFFPLFLRFNFTKEMKIHFEKILKTHKLYFSSSFFPSWSCYNLMSTMEFLFIFLMSCKVFIPFSSLLLLRIFLFLFSLFSKDIFSLN